LFKSNRNITTQSVVSVKTSDYTSTNITTHSFSFNNSELRKRRKSIVRTNRRFSRAKHISYTLIFINFLFLCLVSPLVFVLLYLNGNVAENKLLVNTVYLLAYSNHCLNFIFYGLLSPPYRKCIFKFLSQFKSVHKKL